MRRVEEDLYEGGLQKKYKERRIVHMCEPNRTKSTSNFRPQYALQK